MQKIVAKYFMKPTENEAFRGQHGKKGPIPSKTVRFATITDTCFHQVEIPYETNGELMIWSVPFRPKSTFGTPADANLTILKKEAHRQS